MSKYLARQPIFDHEQKVYAYELLFRSSLDNYFGQTDGDEATTMVIADSFLLFGIESLTGGAKAFINFTKSTLIKEYALILPKDFIVIEVLENVEPDREVLAACKKLKKDGYKLALDDFIYAPKFKPLLELADIVKVDFIQSDEEERARLARDLIPRGIKMLAEKVETIEEFEQAQKMGYTYFQGYFFCKPVIVARKDIPGHKLNLLRIIQGANEPVIDFDRLADHIQGELALSYKLLKLVNSASYSPRTPITSIKNALAYLGENAIRKWTSLLALTVVGGDKPEELIVNSLVRAKFCETMAEILSRSKRASDFFLLGLFSQLDAIVGRPLGELIVDLPLPGDVTQGILGKGPLSMVLRLCIAFQKGYWEAVSKISAHLKIKENDLPRVYLEAIKWQEEVMAGCC